MIWWLANPADLMATRNADHRVDVKTRVACAGGLAVAYGHLARQVGTLDTVAVVGAAAALEPVGGGEARVETAG
ncbi:hypothetical protein GCM10027280_30590 [Micromonospora polyrhachis]